MDEYNAILKLQNRFHCCFNFGSIRNCGDNVISSFRVYPALGPHGTWELVVKPYMNAKGQQGGKFNV